MSRDPEDGKANDPKTLHKYLYAGGNSINYFDPAGRDISETTIITGGSATTAIESAVAITGSALSEAAAQTAQLYALAQYYSGLAYLTAQDVLALISDVAVTKGLVKAIACSAITLVADKFMDERDVPETVKFSVDVVLGTACGVYLPLPSTPDHKY